MTTTGPRLVWKPPGHVDRRLSCPTTSAARSGAARSSAGARARRSRSPSARPRSSLGLGAGGSAAAVLGVAVHARRASPSPRCRCAVGASTSGSRSPPASRSASATRRAVRRRHGRCRATDGLPAHLRWPDGDHDGRRRAAPPRAPRARRRAARARRGARGVAARASATSLDAHWTVTLLTTTGPGAPPPSDATWADPGCSTSAYVAVTATEPTDVAASLARSRRARRGRARRRRASRRCSPSASHRRWARCSGATSSRGGGTSRRRRRVHAAFAVEEWPAGDVDEQVLAPLCVARDRRTVALSAARRGARPRARSHRAGCGPRRRPTRRSSRAGGFLASPEAARDAARDAERAARARRGARVAPARRRRRARRARRARARGGRGTPARRRDVVRRAAATLRRRPPPRRARVGARGGASREAARPRSARGPSCSRRATRRRSRPGLGDGAGRRGGVVAIGTCTLGGVFRFDPFDAYAEGLVTNPNVLVGGPGRPRQERAREVPARPRGHRRGGAASSSTRRASTPPFAEALGARPVALGAGRPRPAQPARRGARRPRPRRAARRARRREPRAPARLRRARGARGRPARRRRRGRLRDAARRARPPPQPERGVRRARSARPSTSSPTRGAPPPSSCGDSSTGELRGMFDGPTTPGADLDGRRGGARRRPARCAQGRCPSCCAARRRRSRRRGAPPRTARTILVLDEAWSLLADEGAARWLQAGFKLARARGVAHVLVLHRLSDLAAAGRGRLGDRRDRRGAAARRRDERPLRPAACRGWGARRRCSGSPAAEREVVARLPRGAALWRVGAARSVVRHAVAPAEAAFVDTDAAMRG